jgi:hypothetical protein
MPSADLGNSIRRTRDSLSLVEGCWSVSDTNGKKNFSRKEPAHLESIQRLILKAFKELAGD